MLLKRKRSSQVKARSVVMMMVVMRELLPPCRRSRRPRAPSAAARRQRKRSARPRPRRPWRAEPAAPWAEPARPERGAVGSGRQCREAPGARPRGERELVRRPGAAPWRRPGRTGPAPAPAHAHTHAAHDATGGCKHITRKTSSSRAGEMPPDEESCDATEAWHGCSAAGPGNAVKRHGP